MMKASDLYKETIVSRRINIENGVLKAVRSGLTDCTVLLFETDHDFLEELKQLGYTIEIHPPGLYYYKDHACTITWEMNNSNDK